MSDIHEADSWLAAGECSRPALLAGDCKSLLVYHVKDDYYA